jgi:hypothetical protein
VLASVQLFITNHSHKANPHQGGSLAVSRSRALNQSLHIIYRWR